MGKLIKPERIWRCDAAEYKTSSGSFCFSLLRFKRKRFTGRPSTWLSYKITSGANF